MPTNAGEAAIGDDMSEKWSDDLYQRKLELEERSVAHRTQQTNEYSKRYDQWNKTKGSTKHRPGPSHGIGVVSVLLFAAVICLALKAFQ
jgi:hypothetical protein